jgi:hypothetical protein
MSLRSTLLSIAAVAVWCCGLSSPLCLAQFGGGGGGFGGGGGGAGGPGGGFPGGILIDSDGVIQQSRVSAELTTSLRRKLKSISADELPADVNQGSTLRFVSLKRLNNRIAAALQNTEILSPELQHLAGLNRIDWVIIDAENHDVLLGGPAEGFAPLPDGRVVGVDSERPVIRLVDLLVLFRNPPSETVFGCSFDPDPARLVQTRTMLSQNTTASSLAEARQGFIRAGSVLGNWQVSVFGVPQGSSVALGFVEADFMLKRIALGVRQADVRSVRSHLALLRPGDNMLSRWWFVPDYDAIERDEAGTMFRLDGPRIQLRAQEELVDANGNRTNAPTSKRSTRQFARQFNGSVERVVRKIPAFAHLQNLIDLSVAMSVVRSATQAGTLEVHADLLRDAERLPLPVYTIPREVPSEVNARKASSRTVVGLIAGGVTIAPTAVVQESVARTRTELTNLLSSRPVPPDDPERWWWDVAE